MTWLDIIFIFIFLTFVALGARMGSLWTGACILGGFLGAALVDIYTLPLAGLMGKFSGVTMLAAVLLYLGGLAAILIPGSVLSKIGSVFILNLIDGAFGLLTGAFAATFMIALVLLTCIPFVPHFESSRAFQHSTLTKPFYLTIGEIFSQTPLKSRFAHKKIRQEAIEEFSPFTKEASQKINEIKTGISNKISR